MCRLTSCQVWPQDPPQAPTVDALRERARACSSRREFPPRPSRYCRTRTRRGLAVPYRQKSASVDFLVSLQRSETRTLLHVAHAQDPPLLRAECLPLSGVVSGALDFLGHELSHDKLLNLAGS